MAKRDEINDSFWFPPPKVFLHQENRTEQGPCQNGPHYIIDTQFLLMCHLLAVSSLAFFPKWEMFPNQAMFTIRKQHVAPLLPDWETVHNMGNKM